MPQKNTPFESTAPPHSRITGFLKDASFHDSWSIHSTDTSLSALDHFLLAAKQTPRWIGICMAVRNRIVQLAGLKNLGALSELAADKMAASYKTGDRVGIFTVFENHFDEALIGDKDKHLDVVLSIHRHEVPEKKLVAITITTVVHVKNRLGSLYMLPVKPMHRLIAPAVLASIGRSTHPA